MKRLLLTVLLIALLIVFLKREGEGILALFGLDVDSWLNWLYGMQDWLGDHMPPAGR